MSTHRRHVLALYKRLLQLQRQLPAPLDSVGKAYIRDEFRQHKEVGPDHARLFLQEWQDYAAAIEKQVKERGSEGVVGRKLSPQEVELFSDQQLEQLYELHQESRKPLPPDTSHPYKP